MRGAKLASWNFQLVFHGKSENLTKLSLFLIGCLIFIYYKYLNTVEIIGKFAILREIFQLWHGKLISLYYSCQNRERRKNLGENLFIKP